MTKSPQLIYVIENTGGCHPYVQVYQLDHETKHCLFLKERGGVTQLAKAGHIWCTSEKEAARRIRHHLDHKIKMLESQLAGLQDVTQVSLRKIPPEVGSEYDSLIL